MSDPAPAIEVHELVKTYAGVTAVDHITFNVARGEIVGFLGPNGAGKSTTMRILTGYMPATAGTVHVCGIPVASRAAEVKQLLGYMPENNPLPEDLRVTEYLYYRGRLKEVPRRKLSARIDEVLELCDLKRMRHRIIGKLSKGFRQRVGIAEAVLAEPPVIIMDEPTIGLDPHQILVVRDLIASLRGRMTVLISSHILPEIEVTCDRVLIINQGKLVAQGTPAELRRDMFSSARYRLEFAGDPAPLRPALSEVDPALRVDEFSGPDETGFYHAVLSSPDPVDHGEAILARLPGTGLRVRALARIQPTLEDVFLEATKRTWEIVDVPPGGGAAGSPKAEVRMPK